MNANRWNIKSETKQNENDQIQHTKKCHNKRTHTHGGTHSVENIAINEKVPTPILFCIASLLLRSQVMCSSYSFRIFSLKRSRFGNCLCKAHKQQQQQQHQKSDHRLLLFECLCILKNTFWELFIVCAQILTDSFCPACVLRGGPNQALSSLSHLFN